MKDYNPFEKIIDFRTLSIEICNEYAELVDTFRTKLYDNYGNEFRDGDIFVWQYEDDVLKCSGYCWCLVIFHKGAYRVVENNVKYTDGDYQTLYDYIEDRTKIICNDEDDIKYKYIDKLKFYIP